MGIGYILRPFVGIFDCYFVYFMGIGYIYGHLLVYLTAISYILWPSGIICVHSVFFPFGQAVPRKILHTLFMYTETVGDFSPRYATTYRYRYRTKICRISSCAMAYVMSASSKTMYFSTCQINNTIYCGLTY
jgi:hypothetical protein